MGLVWSQAESAAFRSLCYWTATRLGQYAAAETPLLDDGGYLNEADLQRASDIIDQEIYDLTHWWEGRSSVEEYLGTDIQALRWQRVKVRERLDDLRGFSAAVSGLFDNEAAAVGLVIAAIASIRRGSLSASGQYVAAPGDVEEWRDQLAEYVADHPTNPRPVFDEQGQYGGSQRWLNDNWDTLSAEERDAIAAIIRTYYPDLTDDQIILVLGQMSETGCVYVATVDSIVLHYANDPAEFRNRFGFPLYASDGSINFNRLFTDYWCYVQIARRIKDPTGGGFGVPSGMLNLRQYALPYLEAHGVTATSDGAQAASTALYTSLSQSGVTSICVNIAPVLLRDAAGALIYESAGNHMVVATGEGVDAAGKVYWTVSSWGKEYRLYPDDYANARFDMDHNGVEDTDTDGDGRPDYYERVDGQVHHVNYVRRFTIETMSFE